MAMLKKPCGAVLVHNYMIISSRIITLLLLSVLPLCVAAREQADSLVRADRGAAGSRGFVRPAAAFAGGALLFGSGAAARFAVPRDFNVMTDGAGSDGVTDYLRYVPAVLPWVMKLSGEPTRSGWGRMAVSHGFAAGLTGSMVYALKHGAEAVRPDNSDTRSFPSGHAAIAFMGATMAAHELGWRSPWYAVGAYAFATGIAVERVVDNRHFPADVVAGAGIGIMATEIGYYLGDLIFGDRQLDRRCIHSRDLRVNTNFSYLSLSTGLALPLGRIRAGSTVISRLPALSAAIRGGWAVDDNFGLAVELGLLSTPIVTDVGGYRTYVKPLSSIACVVMPYYNHVVDSRLSFSAEIGGGYRRNFSLNALDNAVEAGGGTPVGRVSFGMGLRLSDHFTARANVGYEVSRYDFTVRPSTAYMTTAESSCSGISSALLLNISSRYEF